MRLLSENELKTISGAAGHVGTPIVSPPSAPSGPYLDAVNLPAILIGSSATPTGKSAAIVL